jgi:hypothetical protein
MLEDRGGASTGDADSPLVPCFFPGMAWPVPVAFAGAIAAMRFEQGDVLYRDPTAYETLDGKIPKGLSAIQVLLPKRSARVTTSSEFEGDRRQANWQSEVTVELVDLARGQSEVRVLTQGKLAMAIFRGDDAWLDSEREEPLMPCSARELHQRLDETVSSFDARQTARRGSRFLFVVDLASDASRAKAAGVEEALRATGVVDRVELSAEDAGIEDAQNYHPTAVVRCLVMPNRTTDEVLPILRGCLYGGASGSSDASDRSDGSDGDEAAPDRFSVGRHGMLEAIPAEPAATRSESSRT